MLYERLYQFNFPTHACTCNRVDAKMQAWISRCNKAYPILYGIWFRCTDHVVKARIEALLAHFMAYTLDKANMATLKEPEDTPHGHVVLLEQMFPGVRVVLEGEDGSVVGPRWIYTRDGIVRATQ